MLGLVQPVGVQLARRRRGRGSPCSPSPSRSATTGFGTRGLDHVVVLGQRRAARARAPGWPSSRSRCRSSACGRLQDERHLVEARVGVGAAVVDVAHHDPLGDAVAVHVGERPARCPRSSAGARRRSSRSRAGPPRGPRARRPGSRPSARGLRRCRSRSPAIWLPFRSRAVM